MCNKNKAFEREGIRFLLTLPVKHRNHIKTLLLKQLKRKAIIEMAGYEYMPVGNTGWLKLTKIANHKKVGEGGNNP